MKTIDYLDIVALEEAFDAVERDARALVAGLTEAQGTWRRTPDRGASPSASITWRSAIVSTCARCSRPRERALAEGRRRAGRHGRAGSAAGSCARSSRRRSRGPSGRRRRRSGRAPAPLARRGRRSSSRHTTKCGASCAATPASIWPACSSRIRSFAASDSAWPRACTCIAAHERRHLWQALARASVRRIRCRCLTQVPVLPCTVVCYCARHTR